MPRRLQLADLPLYADDLAIGEAVMGAKRAGEWRALVPLLERQGLPKIDRFHGGRYVPGVQRFYDAINGIAAVTPAAPDGIENPDAWATKDRRRRA